MDTFSSYIVHYAEVALKKGNRDIFEKRLVKNIRINLHSEGSIGIRRLEGRIHIEFDKPANGSAVLSRLSRVFGVANAAAAVRCASSIDGIQRAVKTILDEKSFESFAVRTRRIDKTFPLASQKVNEVIGAMIEDLCRSRVDLTSPQMTVGIEILKNISFVYTDCQKGPAGLPLGSSGKVACLISGGIDSPVAAWRVMKRGCLPCFIHFHSAPYTSHASQEKVVEIISHILNGQPSAKLFTVPFGPIQQKVIVTVPAAWRILIYRRLMMRIAEGIAKKEGAEALVTGDALSQVASQTLPNLAAIETVLDLPIIRPLIGMDKQEIVDEAKRIGTYDLSTLPHDDCCSFLMPKNPITRARIDMADKIEGMLDVPALVGLGIEAISECRIGVD